MKIMALYLSTRVLDYPVMSRELISLNVDPNGADYIEAPSENMLLPDGVTGSSVAAMNADGIPVTPKFTGKFDPAVTPGAHGTVVTSSGAYTGRITRTNGTISVAGHADSMLLNKADAIMYDQPIVPASVELAEGSENLQYRVANSDRTHRIGWTPFINIYTSNREVKLVEVFAKVTNNTGEVLTVDNLSFTLTGRTASSQHEVNEVHHEATRHYAKAQAASMVQMAPPPPPTVTYVGETQKFNIAGKQVVKCGDSQHLLFQLSGAGITSQCFHYLFNPLKNSTEYGYMLTFNRFIPAGTVSVKDCNSRVVTNLVDDLQLGSATAGSRYTVIVGGSVTYSPRMAVSGAPTYKEETGAASRGYYRKTTTYVLSELNDQVVVRVPKQQILTMSPAGTLDVNSGNLELFIRDLKVTQLNLDIVTRTYGEN